MGYDIDIIDLYGAKKDFLIFEKRKVLLKYDKNFKLSNYPLETRKVKVLSERTEIKELEGYARIEERTCFLIVIMKWNAKI